MKKIVTKGEKNERIDYVDDNGTITYAADKHYAMKIITRNNNEQFEEFLGVDGKPAKQNLGYFYIRRFYDPNGKEYKTIYLDVDNKPIINRLGYAIVERSFNENGKIDIELFYDENNRPVESNQYGYGCKYEYDNDGQNIKTTYLSIDGEPFITGQGFAIIHKSYYKEGINAGRVKNEYYYNEKEEPIKLKKGEYGLHKDYDKEGRTNTYTYLGIDGNPTNTLEGYTTIIRTYYNDDSVKSDMYYDKDGLPMALSGGQYGVLKKNGQSIWLDINGNEIRSFRNLLFGSVWFSLAVCIVIVCVSSFIRKKYNKILMVLYGVFILYMTIIYRSENTGGINLVPFWSYRQIFNDKELTMEILKNILLFIPFASVLYNVFQTEKILIPVFILSFLIETVQLIWHKGLCEIDDVISNTIGGLIGWGLAKQIKRQFHAKFYKE
ncbi:VanZ family protein [Aristaeella lactis]|uniref:VanZ family protein n=1 Tax=Aristaeella lactis TaxID=3046383 RepID=UPI0015C43642|nr:VanZ family protein [Aristaeella lactis]QUA54033.1 VanZ family protein [Aristaeella lactis]